MKRKLLSTLLILCMILTLLPGVALAANTASVIVGGATLDVTNAYWKNGDTADSRSGSATDWNAKLAFDNDGKATLTLKDAVISGAASGNKNCGIYVGSGDLTIVLEGSSTVAAGDASTSSEISCGVYIQDELTIQGDGTLTATGGNSTAGSRFGVSCNTVTIEGNATVIATGGTSSAFGNVGVNGGAVTIKDSATVTATGGRASDNSYGVCGITVTIEGSATVTAIGGEANDRSSGIYGGSTVSISGGTVTATGGEANSNSYGVYGYNSVSITGGTVTAVGGKPGNASFGVGSSGSVTVSGADAKVVAVGGKANTSYGVYVPTTNGSITYNSGLLVAKGGSATASKAMDMAATGSGATNIISKKADATTPSEWSDKYVVYGKGSYIICTTNESGETKLTTLVNTIIIGEDGDSTSALTLPVGNTLTLAGFNVVLAGDAASGDSYALNGAGDMTIGGSGSLIAIGGSGVNSHGISATGNITLSGGSGVAIAGSATTTAQAMSAAPTLAKPQTITTGAFDGKAYTWSVPVMEVDLDGASGSKPPVKYTDFETGWNYAVADGNNTANTTVKLLDNWTAAGDGTNNSFGTGTGFGSTGTGSNNTGCILVPVDKTITLDLNGKTIDRGLSSATVLPSNGCVIRVGVWSGNNASLTLCDTSPNTATAPGEIGGGYDDAAGGVIVNSGSFTMQGGKITGNKGNNTNGSGVFVCNDTTFTMSGGEITGNTNGAGVSIDGGSGFKVSGTAKVTGNFWDEGTTARNVYLPNTATITVTDALHPTAEIGVTVKTPPTDSASVTVAKGGGATPHAIDDNDAAYFTSDAATCDIVLTEDSPNNLLVLSPKYTVTYDTDGGTTIPAGHYTAAATIFSLPSAPTKSGYTFKGWKVTFAALGGTGFAQDTQYGDDASILQLSGAYGPVTLTAQWTPSGGYAPNYTLSFRTNGGDNVADINKPSGSTIDLTAYTPMREGYTFTGWYGDEALSEKLSTLKLTKSATVYAGWEWVNPFSDVNDSDWFYKDAEYVAAKGLFKGETETAFAPAEPMTRAMLATVLYRLEGEPTIMFVRAPDKVFSDVPDGAWYEKAVQWAQLNGIVEGSDGKFMPDAEISREQLATMLYRYEQHKGGGFTGSWMFPLSFKDAGDVSDWAYEAMCWMTMNKVMQGDGENLMPKAAATRAQVAAMLHRFSLVES